MIPAAPAPSAAAMGWSWRSRTDRPAQSRSSLPSTAPNSAARAGRRALWQARLSRPQGRGQAARRQGPAGNPRWRAPPPPHARWRRPRRSAPPRCRRDRRRSQERPYLARLRQRRLWRRARIVRRRRRLKASSGPIVLPWPGKRPASSRGSASRQSSRTGGCCPLIPCPHHVGALRFLPSFQGSRRKTCPRDRAGPLSA